MDQVFDIEKLKDRALEVLRGRGGFMPLGSIAHELGVPSYAVQVALDAAGREVQYDAPRGWSALQQQRKHTTTEGEQLWGK
jgi:hypothetical protein